MSGRATKDQYFAITLPSGRIIQPPAGRSWGLAPATFERLRADGRIWFGKNGDGIPRIKRYLSEATGQNSATWWTDEQTGTTESAKKTFLAIINEPDLFDFPKPTHLLSRILQIVNDRSAFIVDFFAGSCTTAQAVLELNREDGGNRQFIMVQLPEPTGNAEYATIAEIGKERIRRVIAKLKRESATRLDFDGASAGAGEPATVCEPAAQARGSAESLAGASGSQKAEGSDTAVVSVEPAASSASPQREQGAGGNTLARAAGSHTDAGSPTEGSHSAAGSDLGFKVFKLSAPHIRPWEPPADADLEKYAERLGLYNDPLVPGWTPVNVLWEVALREGYGLNTCFAEKKLADGTTLYEVSDPDTGQMLVVCLDDKVRVDLSRQYELTPERVLVCRDSALDDTAAANLALQCRLKTI